MILHEFLIQGGLGGRRRNFKGKNRKIEISKIVDTSGPKTFIFQKINLF